MPGTEASAGPSLSDDHTLLCAAVREAGSVVLERYRGRPVRNWLKKDRSPVTEADLESNALLKDRLLGARPGYGWLSEECVDDSRRLTASRTFIIDPIDGTRAFIEASPEFTVCAALVEDGVCVSAAVFNPVTDEFFEATFGGGARCNGVPLSPSDTDDLNGARMLGFRRMFNHPGWPQRWPEMQIGYRCSTQYRFALVAKGYYDGALALVPKSDWDVAAGTLIAMEAGALVSDHLGAAYIFNREVPCQRALVCAAPGLYPAIIERLAH
ncbi:MAG: 3'(2'),5'-bisphosphate nucleotidase CysQ, partial [Pseudomonadota bacterium]